MIVIRSRPPLVPPFIILAHIFNLFSYIFKLWCKPKNKLKQGSELHNAMMTSMHAASRPASPTHDIRGITVEIEQIKERRRSGKRPFRTYHKSARSFNFPGTGQTSHITCETLYLGCLRTKSRSRMSVIDLEKTLRNSTRLTMTL